MELRDDAAQQLRGAPESVVRAHLSVISAFIYSGDESLVVDYL